MHFISRTKIKLHSGFWAERISDLMVEARLTVQARYAIFIPKLRALTNLLIDLV